MTPRTEVRGRPIDGLELQRTGCGTLSEADHAATEGLQLLTIDCHTKRDASHLFPSVIPEPAVDDEFVGACDGPLLSRCRDARKIDPLAESEILTRVHIQVGCYYGVFGRRREYSDARSYLFSDAFVRSRPQDYKLKLSECFQGFFGQVGFQCHRWNAGWESHLFQHVEQ